MREVMIDGVRYIPDPKRPPFKAYVLLRPNGTTEVYGVHQSIDYNPKIEQFEITRNEAGSLAIRQVGSAD